MARNDDWGTEGPVIVARSPAETVNAAVTCPCDRMARNADWGSADPGIAARSPADTIYVTVQCPLIAHGAQRRLDD